MRPYSVITPVLLFWNRWFKSSKAWVVTWSFPPLAQMLQGVSSFGIKKLLVVIMIIQFQILQTCFRPMVCAKQSVYFLQLLSMHGWAIPWHFGIQIVPWCWLWPLHLCRLSPVDCLFYTRHRYWLIRWPILCCFYWLDTGWCHLKSQKEAVPSWYWPRLSEGQRWVFGFQDGYSVISPPPCRLSGVF